MIENKMYLLAADLITFATSTAFLYLGSTIDSLNILFLIQVQMNLN